MNNFFKTLTPQVKIIFLLIWSVALLISSFSQLIVEVLLFLSLAITMRVPFKRVFKTMVVVLFLILFIVFLQYLFMHSLYSVSYLFLWGGKLFLRFLAFFFLYLSFTFFTPFSEMSRGFEKLLRPLNLLSPQGYQFSQDGALILTITLRFIPLMQEEALFLTRAQGARGAEFGTWNMGLIKKMKLYIPLIVPLFIAALERSEHLVQAMESRFYYPGHKRSSFYQDRIKPRDILTLVLSFCGFLILIFLNF